MLIDFFDALLVDKIVVVFISYSPHFLSKLYEQLLKKKAGITEDPAEKEAKEAMLKLTGMADSILTRSGNMEVGF